MKASRRNPVAILGAVLLSIGTVSLGLLTIPGLDRISESLESIVLMSRVASTAAVFGALYWWTQSPIRRPAYVRVRV